jgi:tape measure domain-containing protein
MVDIASLAIQIDTSDVARAESDLAKLNGAGTKAEKAAKGVEGAFTGAAKAAGIYRDAAGRLRESNGKLVTESRKVELGLKGVGDQAKRAASEFNGLSNVAGKVGASIVAALSVREVYQATEAYTTISNRLKLVTNSAGEFAAAQAAVFRVAQEGRQPLTETAELYQRIATNQKELGLTGAGVARVTETISKSLAVSGASASTAAGALTQLGQAFASGTLRGEELNSVLEGAPALAQTLARGLNVTVGELRNLGAEGKLTAEQVVGALLSQSEAMDEAFGKLAPNISGAMTTVGNAFTQLIGKMDETSGASSDTAAAIMDVADILADPATVEAAQIMGTGVAKGIGFIAEAATTTVGVVKWMAEELAATFNGIASDDRVRLEDELARLQEMRESGPANRLVFFGRDGVVSYKGDAEIDAEIVKIQQALKAYDELGAAAGRTGEAAASSAPKIEAFRTGTGRLGGTSDDASGKLDKQAVAFQSLMDGLFPAEAAQRKYNEQVALLDKYLDGDQLAKAVQRLNESLYAGDATGPVDAIEDYRKELERLKDDLDPVGVATRKYTKDQDKLNEMLSRGMISAGEHGEMMAELGKRYKENTKQTNQWAEWTESALERVDGAFADAWRNIGDGFKSFADSLKNAFRQMLAELAHMAITRPIVMQIGAALGIGGGAGQAVSMMGGTTGSGGLDAFGLLKNGYSLANSGFGQAIASGWNSGQGLLGGLQGAASSGWQYGSSALGSMFGGGATGGGAAIADYTGAQFGNWVGAQNAAATTWGGAATGLGSIAGGLSGAYMGYQRSGVKGAVAGGLGGWGGGTLGAMAGAAAASALSGTAMGAALGSVLPGIGTVIGAALGAAFGSKLFGGDWQTKDTGLAFGVEGGDFTGQQYEYQKKKGGLFGSNKKRTRYSALDPEFESSLRDTYDATQAGVAELFESLSYSIDDGVFDGLQLAKTQISTKGKTEEEIQQAIADWFGTAAEAMNTELNKVFATGLDLDLAGMQAFVGNLKGVNEVIRYLNVGMYDASVAGGKLAQDLSAVAGGLEALATGTQTYYSAFFSETERAADTLDSVRRTFADAEIPLANSRAAFRAMVEDIDITTEAGRVMFATMMGLAGQAAAYYSIVEQQLLGAASNAFSAVQRSVAAQQKQIQQAYSARVSSLNDMAATASASVSALAGVSNSLEAAIKRLRGTSDDAVRMLRAQATATLQNALTVSRAGQSLAGFTGLQDALDVASEMDTALYGSLEDFQREQGRTANLIAELEKVNGKQLSTEQRLLESVQNQLGLAQQQYDADMAGLDAQLSYAQAQLDALNGIDNSVMGVTAAVAAMNAAVVAALGGLPKGAAQANTPQNNRSIIDTIYQSVLGRGTKGDEAGAAFWANALQTGTASYQDIAASIAKGALGNSAESAATKKSAEQYLKGLGIPGFASGGTFGGGLRLVGENGPELEVTGPSRIYSAGQTAAMLSGGGGEVVAELRVLRTRLDTIEANTRANAQHASKSTRILERVTQGGEAMQTIGATA